MHVYVFVFEHRHGIDFSAHLSYRVAVSAAAAVAREWWDEARERDPSIPRFPPDSDNEAVSLYFDAQEGFEHHEISRCVVEGAADARAALRLLHQLIERAARRLARVGSSAQKGRRRALGSCGAPRRTRKGGSCWLSSR